MDIFNKETGEVFEIQKEKSQFRSITDLKDFSDPEKYEKGSSMVDLTGYEPLESIIARCTRTMVAPGGQMYQVLDYDAVKAESQVVPASVDYEAGDAKTVDEAFATEDPTQDGDFDLADASRVLASIGSASVESSGRIAPSIANEDAPDLKQAELNLSSDSDADAEDELEKKANE